MWSDLRDESEGRSRVQQKSATPDFWGNMIKDGAQVVKHDNTASCAKSIVHSLIDRNTVTLQMQVELEENKGRLLATSAGQQVHSDLGDTTKKALAELEKLQTELHESNQDNTQLKEDIQETQKKLSDLAEQQSRLQNKTVSHSLPLLSRHGGMKV